MKRDEFGPKYEAVLETAARDGVRGVSRGELASAVGSSRQRAYSWVEKNRAKLRIVGRTPEGADKFLLASSLSGTTTEGTNGKNGLNGANHVDVTDAGTINQGSRLLVRNVRWQGGLVLELELEDGTVVVADIRP